MKEGSIPLFEFHISRKARDLYGFDQSLFSTRGHIVFANFHAARQFAQKINARRDLLNFPERAVQAGQINALGMIDEILHHVIFLYTEQVNPRVRSDALAHLDEQFGVEVVDTVLAGFTDEFPSLAEYRRQVNLSDTNEGTAGSLTREILLEEMLLLWITNQNMAAQPFEELFDDSRLEHETGYLKIIRALMDFYADQPPFGPESQDLIAMLRSPAVAVPYSLSGQLEYIRERWGSLLGRFMYRLLSSLDLLKEEEKALQFGGGGGPGPTPIPVYRGSGLEAEPERFSPDREWMPSLVLIAKNSYVWLDQLGKKYSRSIHRLDQIPDAELDTLAGWGISGLWLIGLWERSSASQQIKVLTGNPDAVASAYSLAQYDIAADLGGEEAYQNLRDRAWQRGIRLASDMVPNHMGIDSNWVMDHPDWFLSLDYSPFPSYSFNGPNLSNNDRVSIQLEDHYYDRTDAAVVFKRVDRWSGSQKYIYHGNDGTSMPWNDTAQLNYLNPAVREAVIQTILHVARRFPIIRFDAAMTLAKKHFQRLWFPEPGTGGAIPTRADHGLTRDQFDALMPEEFWREVVDRVAKEAPDTLLLAEAFWLMESYFVRSLGMHRVYNSAFMNLLRNEDNAKYRTILKNTLEFDPEILKRFVNFMNNPDERTAVEQFGKGDKYFGICTLMATLPGLPMLGHGQVEGFAEKYGMEFRRPLWEEQPDPALIQRHEREIFPLLHHRNIFAGVDHFLLYDFYTPDGVVNEEVYAYSNSMGNQRGLVVYHNRFGSTQGWIKVSAAFVEKSSRQLTQKTVADGLGITANPNQYLIFRDIPSGLEFLRSSQEIAEKGFFLDLPAYKTYVFVDFREVNDDGAGSYRRLTDYLKGRGVPSVEEALHELFLQPVHEPFLQLVNPGMFRWLLDSRTGTKNQVVPSEVLDEVEGKLTRLFEALQQFTASSLDHNQVLARETRARLETVLNLPDLSRRFPLPSSKRYRAAVAYLEKNLAENDPRVWGTLFGWLFIHNLGKAATPSGFEEISTTWMDEWQLGQILSAAVRALGLDEQASWQVVNTVRILTRQQQWYSRLKSQTAYEIMRSWLSQAEILSYLGVNRYKDVLWFNQEAFGQLLWWMMTIAIIQTAGEPDTSTSKMVEELMATHELVDRFQKAADQSDYQVDRLMEGLAETTGKRVKTVDKPLETG